MVFRIIIFETRNLLFPHVCTTPSTKLMDEKTFLVGMITENSTQNIHRQLIVFHPCNTGKQNCKYREDNVYLLPPGQEMCNTAAKTFHYCFGARMCLSTQPARASSFSTSPRLSSVQNNTKIKNKQILVIIQTRMCSISNWSLAFTSNMCSKTEDAMRCF